MRLFNVGTWVVLMAALGAPAVTGCGVDETSEGQEVLGTLNVKLTGTSSTGVRYRLRNAIFSVNGPETLTLSSETDLDAASIREELQAGNYLIDLAAGWSLERETAGVFAPVRAVLTSANPVGFAIVDQGVTGVVFAFKAGDDVVELGDGVLELSISVTDGQQCPVGQSQCGTTCVNIDSDPSNCGACGNVCVPSMGSPASCQNGQCVFSCAIGQVFCNGACTDVSSDPNNCGACANACPAGQSCSAGSCVSQTFSETFTQGAPSLQQCNSWEAFRGSIGSGPFSSITLRGSLDMVGVSCTGPQAQSLCEALRDGLPFSTVCNGMPWDIGTCGPGIELSTSGTICGCGDGYTARPCIANENWGGINGPTCSAPTQVMEVACN